MLSINLIGVLSLLVAGAATYWWSMRYGDDWDEPDDEPEGGPPAPRPRHSRPVSRPHSRPSRHATNRRRRFRQTA